MKSSRSILILLLALMLLAPLALADTPDTTGAKSGTFSFTGASWHSETGWGEAVAFGRYWQLGSNTFFILPLGAHLDYDGETQEVSLSPLFIYKVNRFLFGTSWDAISQKATSESSRALTMFEATASFTFLNYDSKDNDPLAFTLYGGKEVGSGNWTLRGGLTYYTH